LAIPARGEGGKSGWDLGLTCKGRETTTLREIKEEEKNQNLFPPKAT